MSASDVQKRSFASQIELNSLVKFLLRAFWMVLSSTILKLASSAMLEQILMLQAPHISQSALLIIFAIWKRKRKKDRLHGQQKWLLNNSFR